MVLFPINPFSFPLSVPFAAAAQCTRPPCANLSNCCMDTPCGERFASLAVIVASLKTKCILLPALFVKNKCLLTTSSLPRCCSRMHPPPLLPMAEEKEMEVVWQTEMALSFGPSLLPAFSAAALLSLMTNSISWPADRRPNWSTSLPCVQWIGVGGCLSDGTFASL